ncbi:uncharacterized protein B0P05DRAFT_568142 [Gilbertella persicaria]|uniref:uncharacterized protein n=1 Tax=Gilbertella persicaria TaxID=101096 RepID=UPI0022210512|nr:uncharacterized protein B0P05DRAFT_568142 [Gilbertella persicaria]KAI8094915.1 hypothetical protein B0P05DRAFT_568142 [Gilbertella persicaria]
MLRHTTQSLVRANSWKNQTVYSCIRTYATPNDKEPKAPLSQRLGGTGRGRILDGASDPFAAFLANAKTNRNRNGNFVPRHNKKKTNDNKDQFADAAEPVEKKQQPRQNRNRPNNNNNNNNNNNRNKQQLGEFKNNNRRTPNNNNNKKFNVRKAAPQEVRTRRATTFIDKDIDWTSFETTTLSTEQQADQVADDNSELVMKDMAGDYDRYLSVGTDVAWSNVIQGSTVSNLVGSNATFDLQQKTAFLAAVSKATGGNTVARN